MIWREDQKYSVFKNAIRMVKTSHNIIGEQCIRSDEKVVRQESSMEKLLWEAFEHNLRGIRMACLKNIQLAMYVAW